MYMVACISAYVPKACSACGDQNWISDPLVLELQTAVSKDVDSRNQT